MVCGVLQLHLKVNVFIAVPNDHRCDSLATGITASISGGLSWEAFLMLHSFIRIKGDICNISSAQQADHSMEWV